MKLLKIDHDRFDKVVAKRFLGNSDTFYYGIEHGQTGKNGWCVRTPLSLVDFPVPPCGKINREDYFSWECTKNHVGNMVNGVSLQIGDECPNCLATTEYLFLQNIEFQLESLKKKDIKGNDRYILSKGQDDGTYLIFWNLTPGFFGQASYHVEGKARIISIAWESRENDGKFILTACPIVHVSGKCVLHWKRTGRLYGNPYTAKAVFNKNKWEIV